MVDLVLLGGGGQASDVLGVVEALQAAGEDYRVIGLLADDSIDEARFVGRGVRHLGPISSLVDMDVAYVVAVGYPAGRRAVQKQVESVGRVAMTLVHPTAVVGAGCQIGPGTVVFDGVHLSAMVRLGPHTSVSYQASVGHDCVVGAFVSLMPGSTLSGNVVVGDDVLVGTHAAVLEQLVIGPGATVGAGSTVVADVPPGVTVFGSPARPDQSRPVQPEDPATSHQR